MKQEEIVDLIKVILYFPSLVISIYGMYLAFSASVSIGIGSLILSNSYFIIGIIKIVFDINLAEVLLKLL